MREENLVTLEEPKGRIILVRCHTEGRKYDPAFVLAEESPEVWIAKIAMEAMTMEQRRDFTRAVLEHGGIRKIKWEKYVPGGIIHRETNF